MKSIDQMLLEETYQRIYLKEDPDISFSPLTQKKLKHNSKDAISFGWVNLAQKNPLMSYDSSTPIGTIGGFGPEWKKTLFLSKPGKIHGDIFNEIMHNIQENNPKQGILVYNPQKININFAEKFDPADLETAIFRMDINVNPRRLMIPCGRIWIKNKVISFWTTPTEVLLTHVIELFDNLNIPREQLSEYYIEFPADNNPKQTVEQHFKTSIQYSKEEEKKAAEAMAKAHEVAAVGTKDKDVQKIIDDRKKAMAARESELRAKGIRQSLAQRQAMSSESFIKKSSDQELLEEAYRKVLENVSGVKKQPYWYLGANCTVDLVVMYKGKILLIQRKAGGVEGGKWAIPGGFIDTESQKGEVYRIGKESPKQAALREVQEETNLDLSSVPNIGSRLKEVGVYEGNYRDPRDNDEAWSKSYAFTITLRDEDGVDFSAMRGMDDASDARWFSIDKLPSDLAFDHGQIIKDSLDK